MDEIIQLIWEFNKEGEGLLTVRSNIRDMAGLQNYERSDEWVDDGGWDEIWPQIPVAEIRSYLDGVIQAFNEQGFFITASYTESKISHFITMQKFNSRSHD